MIKRVHHVQITVPSAEEKSARDFYCGFLGLKEIPKADELAKNGGFWLELGDLQIHVSLEDGMDRSKTRNHIAYEVDDLNFWRQKLSARGFEFKDRESIPGYGRLQFRDPFGNLIEMLG